MKRGVKITLITLGGLVALVLILAVVLPIVFKPQLLKFAQQEISKRVEADVTIGDLRISLLKAFPRLYVGLDEISVVNREPFAGDTLAAFDRLGVAVNLKTLFDPSKIEVYNVELKRLRAYAHRDTFGRANWDILPTDTTLVEQKPKKEKGTTEFGLALQQLVIEDAVLSYKDDSARLFAEARDLDFALRGDISARRSSLDLLLTIAKTTFEMGGNVMAPGLVVSLQAAVDADLENARYTLGDNELKINDLGLKFSGIVEMPGDSIVTDMRFGTSRTDFKTLLSLIPAMYKRGLADVQTSGMLQLDGVVKGTIYDKELPNANLALKVDNARFQYPSLPKGVENIGIDLKVDFDGKNIDRTLVDLNRLHAEIAGNKVDAAAHLRTPLSDPSVRANVFGKVDLGALKEVLPLDSLTLSGLLDLSVKLAATQSKVEQKRYEECELEGHVKLTDAVAVGVMPMAVSVPTLQLSLSPKVVRVEDLQVQAGRSDVRLSGGVSEFLPYLMTDGTVKGDLTLHSKRLDLNELFPKSSGGHEEAAKPDSSAAADTSVVVDLSSARRVEFAFSSRVDSLYFQNLKASDVKGRFVLKGGKLTLDEIAARALGGAMQVSGDFNFSDAARYKGQLKADLSNVSVRECVETFVTLERLLSSAKYMSGTVSLDIEAATDLSPKFSVDLKSLQASGSLRTSVLALNGVPAFEKIGALLKNDYVSRPALERAKIPFTVTDGNVIFSPFDFAVKGVKVTMGGKVGLDQTLDYAINMLVPRSFMGKGAEALSQLEAKLPSGLTLGETIPVGVRVSGSAASPKVELTMVNDLKGQLKGMVTQKVAEAKQKVAEKVEEVKEQVQDKIDEGLAKAEAEAARIRQQARESADRVLAEAQAKANQLVAEAEKRGPLAGVAAKKAADRVMAEAQTRANGILSEANQKADALLAEAKAKSQL